ncbi:MAG TPA: helix-turn-helix domain-containing protein [Candidatus Nanoarchaeia archaeon]|nr:helix-turn-helix domain-containing protein [Candidatus Nanoarchaeia archaeon]
MKLPELKILGLTNGEIKVYSAILDIGSATINKIHEKTGLERRGIYDIINKLVEKSLITYIIERGKRTYCCSPPDRLREKVNEKKREIENLEQSIPKIEDAYKTSKPKVGFEIFRGKEGIKTVFEDMLNHKDIYAIGGGFYIVKELPYYWPHYNKRRIKKKVIWHNLVRNELRGKIPENKFIKVKFLPKELSGNPVVIIIYGNKVANLSWEDEEWFAFVIENKEIAESYKKYHQYLWNKAAKSH